MFAFILEDKRVLESFWDIGFAISVRDNPNRIGEGGSTMVSNVIED